MENCKSAESTRAQTEMEIQDLLHFEVKTTKTNITYLCSKLVLM